MKYPRQISEISESILDPLLRKRAGISLGLVQSWEEIAGARLAERTRPEKIVWPRRLRENDPFEPATLIIACEGSAALHLQHETGEVISRVNAFLGFNAIGRIKIVQKPVVRHGEQVKPRLRVLTEAEKSRLSGVVSGIEDEGLKAALEKLGTAVLGEKKQK
ncbi:DUF721 domain-containing protein [Oryzicola mucosus]|uniref:DUF721 domain-containing protein n=1 Tax=Oryzicola mucosus TaxID=2767425 RepID=A0A8J6PUM3_9HYPH|nr:DUF721 domain-containing protein [Oryzicola mucosus]MBD0416009.1 DUF721 domain-containing protein [Oryzicola mucosus]